MTWSMQSGRRSFTRVWFAIIACFIGALSHASAQVLSFEEAKQRADQGDAFAQAVVALHYQLGWNTQKNPELAAKYALTSANAGHHLGKFRLGALMRVGEGVSKNEQQGLALQSASFNELRSAQDPYSITSAAIMIFQGKVVDQNIPEDERRREAAALYKKAADMGYPPAQFNYAMALNDGHGVSKDPSACEAYLSQALASSYPPAQQFELEKHRERAGSESQRNLSVVEGVNSDDQRWAYEFVETTNNGASRESLRSLVSERLLFANDDWIVSGSLVKTGLGRARTVLSFYDARSLSLKAGVSVPNAVTHVDWSGDRKQFLAVTTRGEFSRDELSMFLKWPDDVVQALVLIDIAKKHIERAALWNNSENDDFNFDPNCAPQWKGNLIEVAYTADGGVGLPPKNTKFHSPSFADISINYRSVADTSQTASRSSMCVDTSSLDSGGISHGVKALLEASGGYYSGSKDFLISSLRPSIRRVTRGREGGVNLVRPLSAGALSRLNLSTLTSFYNKLGDFAVGEAGIFSDGTLYAVVMDPEGMSDGDGARSISGTPSEVCYLSPTGYVERIRLGGVRPVFGDTAFYYLPAENDLLINRVDSLGNRSEIKANVPDKSARSPALGFSRSLDPSRNAVGLVFGPEDDPLDRTFKEFDWTTGELLSGPTDAATGKGYFDRIAGSAPPGWVVESVVTYAGTGGVEYTVFATNLSSRNKVEVATDARLSGAPVMIMRGKDRADILSTGRGLARINRVDLGTGFSEKIHDWEWDEKDGYSLFEPSNEWLLAPTPSGYYLFSPFEDNPSKKLADIYFEGDNDYAIVLPNGYYAGSPGCESLLRLQAGDGLVDGSSIAPWRNRPAEVLRALGGDAEQIEVLAKVMERWHKRIGFDPAKPEPKASDLPKLSVPERPPLWSKGEEAGFAIQWQKGASPIENVVVRVNGVESARFEGATLRAATEDKGSVDVTVKLAEGQNWIEVTAEDVEGRRSDLQRFRTILKDSPPETKRYIVALGVSDYARPELNLQFASKDAKDLVQALGGEDKDHALLLTDEQVDQSAVDKIREFVGQSSESDEVVLFCAGHGILDNELDYYYAGHDFNPDRPAETGIKLDDLVGAVSSAKALKRLMLLDTCHAGVVGEKDEILLAQMDTKLPSGVRAVAQRGMKVQQAPDFSASDKQRFIEEMFSLPGTIRGVNIIGASAGAQFALESDKWNNGVFTASVIQGLRDKKADWNEDGRITVSELKNYLGQRVSELTAGAQKPSVVAFEQDQDFNLLN